MTEACHPQTQFAFYCDVLVLFASKFKIMRVDVMTGLSASLLAEGSHTHTHSTVLTHLQVAVSCLTNSGMQWEIRKVTDLKT